MSGSFRQSDHYNQVSAGFVRLHDSVGFLKPFEAEGFDRLDVKPAGCGVGGDPQQPPIGPASVQVREERG
jgi:hypothetical protein